MEQSLIQPNHYTLPRLNSKVVLLINLEHFFLFRQLVNGSNPKSFGPIKRFNFDIGDEKITALGGMIGAAKSVMSLENAVAFGGREFYALGTAGWISKEPMSIGEVLVPKSGWDETGLATEYEAGAGPFELSEDVNAFGQEAMVSINGVYRLTPSRLERFRKQQIGLVDMEMVPLCVIAKKLGVELLPHLVVSDVLGQDMVFQNGLGTAKFNQGLQMGLKKLQLIFNA